MNRLLKEFFFVTLLVIPAMTGCRHDAVSESAEEAAYMADYESPASKWGFINKEGKLVVKPVYDDVGAFSEGLAAVNHNGLWGFIDHSGKRVIKPIYRSAWAFHEKKARVLPFDQPEQYIDAHGHALKADGWVAADDFSNGRARVKVGDTFGYIDSSGLLVIQPIYTRGWNFNHGLCIVEYQEKLGVIDLKGSYVIPPDCDFIKISGGPNNIILCHKGNVSIAYDIKGSELARLPGSKMVDSDGQLISVRDKESMYFFDLKNQVSILQSRYSNIIYLEDSFWAGKSKEGYLLLDAEGHPLSSIAYRQINKFSHGLAAFSKGDFWGYIDEKGVEKTSDVFGLAWDYKEGLARAAFKDGIAYIDENQKLAFYPPEGSIDLRDYAEGLAAVQFR